MQNIADQTLSASQKQEQLQVLRAFATQKITALVSQIAAQVNLTDDQKASVKAILQRARFAATAILTDDSSSKGEKRTSLMALRNKTRADVAALLTPTQQSQAAAIANQIRPVLMQKAAAWRSSGAAVAGWGWD